MRDSDYRNSDGTMKRTKNTLDTKTLLKKKKKKKYF